VAHREAVDPVCSKKAMTFRRPLDRQPKSMSCSRLSRGGKSGQRTRTAKPPSNRNGRLAPEALSINCRASTRGSSAGPDDVLVAFAHRPPPPLWSRRVKLSPLCGRGRADMPEAAGTGVEAAGASYHG
jgi:hypothetical protein